jgi:hypothetical protein
VGRRPASRCLGLSRALPCPQVAHAPLCSRDSRRRSAPNPTAWGALRSAASLPNPPVTTRRREDHLPASLVSWPFAASLRLLGPQSRPLGKSKESVPTPPERSPLPPILLPYSVE